MSTALIRRYCWVRLIGRIPLLFEQADFAKHVLALAGCHGHSLAIPAPPRPSGCSPLVALRCVLRAIFGAIADTAAGTATSIRFVAADRASNATDDTDPDLVEAAAANNRAAAGTDPDLNEAAAASTPGVETPAPQPPDITIAEADRCQLIVGSVIEVFNFNEPQYFCDTSFELLKPSVSQKVA